MDVKSIRQAEAAECGLVCLAIASGMLGASIELSELRRKHPVSTRGMNLEEIISIASSLDMTSRPLKCELEELNDLRVPAILHWGFNHFVVLINVKRNVVTIQDPSRGVRKLSIKEVASRYTGVALELSRAPAFRKKKERSPLQLTSLFRFTPEISTGLIQTLILSVMLQVYVIASPFYMQLAIDEAAMKGDIGLLGALAIGFSLFGAFNVVATALRSVAIQKMSSLLGWDMTGRLFHHLMRLPLPWFQRRRLADSLSRFESIEPVRGLFANGLVGSVIDGMMSIITLIMMTVFAWPLAIVAALGVIIYIAIRLTTIPMTIRLSGDALVASVAEQGKRIEMLRAMQTIKVMGAESQRESDWANRYAETIRTRQASAFAQIGFSSLQGLADMFANAAIIYLGAKAVIDGSMTVGVLYAFMAYKTQFVSRAQGFFETFVQWRMLDLHSDRLADIALTPVERGIDDAGISSVDLRGGIELRNLAFRYSPQEPTIFQGVTAKIHPGEFVAIIGPSGSGKSTLVKVICGLYPSNAGDVLMDGLPISTWGPRTVRRNLGVVMQDDELIAGSIAENVAFFAEEIDISRVWECLSMAALDEEIRAMPMQAETFVGDMGSALSGGQKQRVLLARALYKRPKILILDEATSHLDIERESRINASIRDQTMTRIIVAHRPETIAAADRVLLLSQGRLVEAVRQPNIAGTKPVEIDCANSN